MASKMVDRTGIVKSTVHQRASVFIRLAADRFVQIARPTTPKKEGNLSRDVLRTVLGLKGRVEWRKGYATYQERGRRFDGSRPVKNYTTPGTGPKFARKAADQLKKETNIIARLAHLV